MPAHWFVLDDLDHPLPDLGGVVTRNGAQVGILVCQNNEGAVVHIPDPFLEPAPELIVATHHNWSRDRGGRSMISTSRGRFFEVPHEDVGPGRAYELGYPLPEGNPPFVPESQPEPQTTSNVSFWESLLEE